MRHVFRISGLMTLLLLLSGSFSAWAQPTGYSVNSRGNLEDNSQVNALYRIDLSTGATEYIGWTSFIDIEGLAFSPNGVLYGAADDDNTLVRISTETGQAVAINNQRRNLNVPRGEILDSGLAFTCEGDLLMVSDRRRSLYQVSIDETRLEVVGEEGALNVPITAISVWGDQVYGIGQGLTSEDELDSPNLYRIDPTTGTTTLVGPLGAEANPYANAGLAFDETGTLWAVTDRLQGFDIDIPSEILRIDPATGTAEKVADADIVGFESLAIGPPAGCDRGSPPPPTVVPTLSPLGLILLSFLLGLLATASIRSKFA
ncbi:MAG: IPTL-CTERM sorting domain-containing protein [Pseudomonadota bacterium]